MKFRRLGPRRNLFIQARHNTKTVMYQGYKTGWTRYSAQPVRIVALLMTCLVFKTKYNSPPGVIYQRSLISLWLIIVVIIPPETKFRGGILDSPCSSVRPSVRLSVRPWVGVRMITLILFSGFNFFFLHISLGSRSCMGLNISVLPH